MSGAQTPINVTSFTRVLTTGTIVTATDHDATKGLFATPTTVNVSEAFESEFNGDFPLLSVTNRRTLVVSMPDSGGTVASGGVKANNVSNTVFQNYNGLIQVTAVPTLTSFQYAVNQELPTANGTPIVRSNVRVSASATIERAVSAYTKQKDDKAWAFVVLGATTPSKNRDILSDAVDNQQRSQQGDAFKQQTSVTVSVFVFIPTAKKEIAGRLARDVAQDLFRPICQSILFKKFDSGLFVGEYNPLMFAGHDIFDYNTSYYVHEYIFTQEEPLQFEDSIGFDDSVAFRDVEMTQQIDFGTEQLTASIDLDDTPL